MSEILNCPTCGKNPGTSGRILDGVDVVENVACCNAWFGDPKEWNQYAAAMALAKAEVNSLKAYRVPLGRIDAAMEAAEGMVEQARVKVLEIFKLAD